MKISNVLLGQQLASKAYELGMPEEFFINALYILSQNKEYVNAIDNRTEMDDYIYRSIIKDATIRRKKIAQDNLRSGDGIARAHAAKDLMVLSRDEIVTEPYYRAILPLLVKILGSEPIHKLHAEEASEIILQLADFKRKHRATSVTEVIVTHCKLELEAFYKASISEAELV